MREAALAPARLLSQVRRLELAARRNTAGTLAADWPTTIRGQGMLFHESRKYVAGEPARSIDWNVTARLGEPYVKVHLEERQREVVFALDLSPSMWSGSQSVTRLELAVELAATLAVSAIDAGDRLGHVLFADRVLDRVPPAGGRASLFRSLAAILKRVGPWPRPVPHSDLLPPIQAIEAMGRRRLVVFLISDFADPDLPEDLRYLRRRHDVSLLRITDPLESGAADDRVVFPARSPEGPAMPVWVRPGEIAEPHGRGRLEQACARMRLGLASFSTAEPLRPALSRFLHRRRRQLRRAR